MGTSANPAGVGCVAVIADTHLPKGKRQIPPRCLELMTGAAAILHAGDISTPEALRALQELGPPVHAVRGNVDDRDLQRVLPLAMTVLIAGRPVAITHDAGPARGRLRRLRAQFPDADAVVFGHSHIPLHEELDGFQIFNPGSPTERRRAPQRSMGILRASRGGLRFSHVWLGSA